MSSLWPALMRFGLGTLRLSPRDFWAMSLPELRAALDARKGAAPPDRESLARMMRRFPDTPEAP